MNPVPPHAPEARAANAVYSILPARMAPLLLARLRAMHRYADARRATGRTWEGAAVQLHGAMAAVVITATARTGRRHLARATVRVVLDAIMAFERAYAVSLPYDDHGRYSPEPGTEYPFSVSDVGRAAVRLLGPDWHAESASWGVGASIEHKTHGLFTLGVDEDEDLCVTSDRHGTAPLFELCAADGLDTAAARVADAVRAFTDRDRCPSGQTAPECTESDPCEGCWQNQHDHSN
ncbi:hypothetical protein QR97_01805 [Streptomyces sp. PBH53]|uniref:hypothetical protein n=1 Tax=Streptomyces sp. PBH53 TaxID=1577075 RepID=UPI000655C503|nr:hypothetical protein [Streptomyces sp. PBH53]AKN68707.1 hypothetical protein QR97_01805 [Streptomyces sp. PBH53]